LGAGTTQTLRRNVADTRRTNQRQHSKHNKSLHGDNVYKDKVK